jgi:hypothetical protein
MAIPLFVQHNDRTRRFKTRVLFEQMSDSEVRKHTELPWLEARELLDWLEPDLEPITKRNHAVPAETKILASLGFFRSGSFQWVIVMGTASGTSQPSLSRAIDKVNVVI